MIELDPCLGVRVVYCPELKSICEARGIGRWQKVVIGKYFLSFAPAEQQAFLMHEVGHCKLRHIEKRMKSLWFLLWNPKKLIRLCVEQEFEADEFARRAGYGMALYQAFERAERDFKPRHRALRIYHPSREERKQRLLAGT